MTFLDVTAHYMRTRDEKEALLEEQVRLKDAYCCELEDVIRHDADHLDIAAGMIAVARSCSKAAVLDIIACEYETRQARKAAV